MQVVQQQRARIYLVRHGETDQNKQGIIQGQLDTELNVVGVEQARVVAQALKKVPFVMAFSSDLERAAKTAEAILEEHHGVMLMRQSGLRERFMGKAQGKRRRGVKAREWATIELGNAFVLRVLAWWDEMIAKPLSSLPLCADTIHVLVVSHGAYISTLVRALIAERKIRVDHAGVVIERCLNTSVTEIELRPNEAGRLLRWADISHLLQRRVVETNADEVEGASTSSSSCESRYSYIHEIANLRFPLS